MLFYHEVGTQGSAIVTCILLLNLAYQILYPGIFKNTLCCELVEVSYVKREGGG